MLPMYKLGEFVSLKQGLAINKGTTHLISDSKTDVFIYPLLRIADMINGTFEKYVSNEVNATVIADVDDIVYTRTGQIGLAFRGFNGCVHNNSFIVSLTSSLLDKDYLFVILKSPIVRNQALSLAKNSVQPDLTHDMFKSITIPVPSIEVQRKIASMYLNLDAKIALNKSICSDLEAMAKLIYDYWFVQFDFPDENGKPYKSSGGKMIYNEELKREIPEGWEVKPLKGLYCIKRGLSYTSDKIVSGKGIPMINLACIDRNRNYRDGELKYYDGKIPKEAYLKSGDLLIACTDLTRKREIIGCPILVPADNSKYTYSMDIANITFPDNNINDLYMYMALRTNYYHNYIKTWASGTNVLHLNLKGLDYYKMYMPPIALQDKFSNIIHNIHKKKSNILIENRDLVSLRDFLLPMLMNGQVKVGNPSA